MTEGKPRINNLDVSDDRVIRRAEESHEFAVEWIKATLEDDASTVAALRAERDELRKALEPSAENEIAYLNDEVTFWITDIDGDGHAYRRREIVPWSAVEEIMAKIRARAALSTKPHTQETGEPND